jgi:ketosteroid isomerase-like protein
VAEDQQFIAGLEKARREAILAADKAALEALLSDTLIWTHANGATDSKATYLAKQGGKSSFLSMEVVEEQIAIYGDAAAVAAELVMGIAQPDKAPLVLRTRASSVWAKEADVWRLTRFHSGMVS